MSVLPGFRGLALLTTRTGEETKLRFTDNSLNISQEVQFYDHTIGLRDTIPEDGLTTKEEQSEPVNVNIQKTFWRPGVKIVNGGLTLPATDENISTIWNLAKKGETFEIACTYDCYLKRVYKECIINSFNLSCSSGEFVNLTFDVSGRYISESYLSAPSSDFTYTDTQKLITWDALGISISGFTDPIQNFDISISNNCIPIYTSGSNTTNSLWPKDIRVGMQEVSGSIVYYVRGRAMNQLSRNTSYSTINLTIGTSFSSSLRVVFLPITRTSAINAPLHTLGFVGVDRPLGT